ncbi:hypothetical protein BI344_21820 [Chromobacterium sphagni]|uniref:Solute-binding protein family 3/N-terminal domain-containing protein n=2 Tax=Chromobacterium sphagni TaxID=1903179 RepID=A0ABX3C7G0_9NEIS|nr:hypothetical protein BI344_21820 [Chromobacterium sphagni]
MGEAMASWKYALMLVVSLSFCAGAARAGAIVLGATEYPPYMSPRLPGGGLAVAIVSEAFQRAGLQTKIVYLPWSRAMSEAGSGQLDGIIGLWETAERKQRFLFSKPFLDNHIGLFKRSGDAIRYQRLSDLKPYTIGTVRGYANPEAFEQARLKTDETLSDASNLAKLAARHIDLALIDHGVANYLLRGNLAALAEKLEWLPPAVVTYPMRLGIARNQAEGEKRIQAFNRGLDAMQRDGTLEKMLKPLGI